MLRYRGFLFGLGIGIIAGALLFQLMLLGEESKRSLQQLGSGGSAAKTYTRAEVDALLEAERVSAELDGGAEKAAASMPAEKLSAPEPEAEAVKEAQKQHIIRIEAGYDLTRTSELLAEQRVIADKAEFVERVKRSNKLVRAGYFRFYEGMTAGEAMKIVTSQPLTKAQAEELADGSSASNKKSVKDE